MRNPFLYALHGAILLAISTAGNFGLTAPSHAKSCKGQGRLGVHRTVTLNTSGGKRYGSSHGRDVRFLRKKEVVLTFDDGPVPATTNKILHELERHCAKATFFMVGSMVRAHPSTARRVAAKGHTIGIHSDTHQNLGLVGGSVAIPDVDRSIKTIKSKVSKNVAPFFRFPYLSENQAVNRHLAGKGYGVFAIDVDSIDYKLSSTNSLVNRVMSELRRQGDRGIILLHDIKKVTSNGIGPLLDRLHQDGYKLVHIKGRGKGIDRESFVVASATWQIKDKTKGPLVVLANRTWGNESGGTQESNKFAQAQALSVEQNVARKAPKRNSAIKRTGFDKKNETDKKLTLGKSKKITKVKTKSRQQIALAELQAKAKAKRDARLKSDPKPKASNKTKVAAAQAKAKAQFNLKSRSFKKAIKNRLITFN